MGSGKTCAMINYINASSSERKFIFVTPFLSEGDRIKENCPEKEFCIPSGLTDNGKTRSKLIDFKSYLREGRNVVTTHALFSRFDEETRCLIKSHGYTLIMDEAENDVACIYPITSYDASTILNTYVECDERGKLIWSIDKPYYGRFNDYKEDCDNGLLWKYHGSKIIKMLPESAFSVFEDVYILTYMFYAQMQRAYFDLLGLSYEYVYVEGDAPGNYRITTKAVRYDVTVYKDKIHICDDSKLNSIGECKFDLSRSWFENAENEAKVKQLANNVRNYFKHKKQAPQSDTLWTTYKEKKIENGLVKVSEKKCCSVCGYSKSFLSSNSRATNVYRDREYLAYPINLFVPPELKNFFERKGIHVDSNAWALSMMLQWLWRGTIRDGKDMWVYIPSKRMRDMFIDWLDGKDIEKMYDDINEDEDKENCSFEEL